MANQKTINWFLNIYDSGKQITPEILEVLVKDLRPKNSGRPPYKITHLIYLALNEICTVETMVEYTDAKDVSSIRRLIQNAKNEGWEVIDFRNVVDTDGKKIKKNKLTRNPSRQIWLDNGIETRRFTFKLDAENHLTTSYEREKYD